MFALDSLERTATDVAREISAAGERDDAETEDEDGGNDDEEEQKQEEESGARPASTAANTAAAEAAAAFVSPRATRRTTLSPSKTSLFMNNSDSSIIDDSVISRRDTVSPAALKSLLQSITLNDENSTATRARQEKAVSSAAPTAENDTASSDSDGVHDYIREYMGASNQFLESSSTAQQTPESARRMRAMKRKEREERTLSPSEALSITLSELTPRRSSAEKSKTPAKRSLLSPESRGTVTLQEDTQEVEEDTAPQRQLRSSEKSRRLTLEPTDAADFLSALREEMQEDAKHESSSGSASKAQDKSKRRQTITTHFETDVSPVTRSRSRRATVDPSDIISIASEACGKSRDEAAKDDEGRQTRRETLEVEDLYEINPELRSTHQATAVDRSTAMDVDAEANGLNSQSRKRKQDQPATDATTSSSQTGKKPRSDDDDTHTESPPQDSLVSRKTKEAAGLTRPQKSPTPRKPPRSVTSFAAHDRDREEKTSGRQSVRGDVSDRQSIVAKFSSPAQSSKIKTPLKSILSAKKPKLGPITTPIKSVNFGPSQGAEFNLGSPSTSMTPMLAKDARRMFPLDGMSSPPSLQELDEEEEDEETSLNTSLLDEADAIDSDDAEQKEERDDNTTEMAISRLSFSTSNKSPENRRRYSLRGVSPMDNQANARRWRRNSASAVVRSPVSARKLKGIGPYALQSLPAPPSASKSNFLAQTNDTEPQKRTAYADSSASSDAGEDMEITGDFSAFVQAGGTMFASNSKVPATTTPSFRFRSQVQETKESSLSEDSPVEDETVELGSLGDLVAESAAYDGSHEGRVQQQSTSQKSSSFVQGEDDLQAPALGSLSDLAREAEEQSPRTSRLSSSTIRRFNSLHYSQLDDQDVTLDPIMEEEEDATNSSAPSMMDMETSEDESDAEYDERRKSLVVNLSSKFERVGSGTPKSRTAPESELTAADLGARIRSPSRQSPRRKSVALAAAPTIPLISMEELLTTADLQTEAPTTPDDHFSELYSSSTTAGLTVDAVKRASISNACKDIVKWHIDEISSWSAGLTDVLGSLLSERAPAMFSPELFDESGVEAVKALHDLETARVQSGLCQWRTKMESQIGEKLQASAGELEKDVRTLKQRIAKDTATRQSELAALQELIDREKQMSELLDAIEEQQSVRNEYAATVDVLDTQCASLSLEASVLEDQLRVVENLAADGNLISAEAAAELERQVLNVEEVSAIQGSLSVWRIGVATSSHLKLSAQFDDVVVRVDLQVDVVLNGSELSSNGGFSTDVASSVTMKRKRRSSYLAEADSDIVRLVQQKLFDPVQLSRFIRTTNSSQHGDDQRLERPRRICALLQELERYVTLSHRFLRELRLLSAQYAVEFITEESVLWVEFLNFTPLREAKFVVGFAILDEFPFSNFETSVHVVYGPVRQISCCYCLWRPETCELTDCGCCVLLRAGFA